MSQTIKSVKFEIGANTSSFLKEIKKCDKEINLFAKQADALKEGLKIEFDEKKFTQAQKLSQQALKATEEKAEALRKQLDYIEKTKGVDSEDYAKLSLELAKADTKALKLQKSIEEINALANKDISKNFKDLGNTLTDAGKKMSGVSLVAGGLLAGSYKLANDARKAGDDIATMASQYDMSTKAIQRWQYVALQGDVPAEKLFKGANKIRDALGSQMQGEVNNATKVLDQLGVKLSDFDSQDDAFAGTLTALSNVKDSTLQYNMAVDLFGEKMATDIIPLLQAGGGAIAGWSREFETMGYLTDSQVQSMAKLDESMNSLNTRYENAKTQLGVALLPVMEIFADSLEDVIVPAIQGLAEWFGNLDPKMQNVVIGIIGIIAIAAPLLMMLGKASQGISIVTKLFGKLKSASTSAKLGIAALVGAFALGVNIIGDWKNMSTVEKKLKSLALAALVTAAAVGVFHSSWSLGIAVGAITAGIVAAVAAVNAAKKKLLPKEEDIDVGNLESQFGGANGYDFEYNLPNYSGSGGNSSSADIIDSNNNYNIEVHVASNEYVSPDEIVDIVSKKLATQIQAKGRI